MRMSKSLPRLRGAGLRRLGIVLTAAALVAAGCGAPGSDKKTSNSDAGSDVPDKPSAPVTLTVFDVAGNLQLSQGIFDNFVKEHSDIVSRVVTQTGKAPDLAGKIKAQQDANRIDIDLVLTGTDGLSAGISQGLWTKLTPDYNSKLPKLSDTYQPDAAKMQDLAQGYGVELVYYPSGPLLEYNPKTVPNPPKTAQELLDWAKAHPNKFMYAQPKNSGPGRTLLMGLPYILKDKDPKNPQTGWDNTWAYLKELNQYIRYYPTGTTETMKNLADGSVDIIASTTGWDINPRALGTVPADMKVATLDGFHWVNDAQYVVVPKGVSKDKLSAILQFMKYMLQPKQQAITFDKGYFYPGPAVKGVTIDMAPQESQDVISKFGRPEYKDLIANNPNETSLPASDQVTAFDTWDRTVPGDKVGKK
jgi:putative spermidine/putrescine transport system substrate-binding protein